MNYTWRTDVTGSLKGYHVLSRLVMLFMLSEPCQPVCTEFALTRVCAILVSLLLINVNLRLVTFVSLSVPVQATRAVND